MGIGVGIAGFICFLANGLLSLLLLAIIIGAILSWLFAFDIVNPRNQFVAGLSRALDVIVTPVLSPLRNVIPSLGGIDITPIIAILIIRGIQIYLMPPSCAALAALFGGI